ncbi:unnamed protein product [Heterobilharzia americana]|nr:unnamed protein product [Heterobilharzia americana]
MSTTKNNVIHNNISRQNSSMNTIASTYSSVSANYSLPNSCYPGFLPNVMNPSTPQLSEQDICDAFSRYPIHQSFDTRHHFLVPGSSTSLLPTRSIQPSTHLLQSQHSVPDIDIHSQQLRSNIQNTLIVSTGDLIRSNSSDLQGNRLSYSTNLSTSHHPSSFESHQISCNQSTHQNSSLECISTPQVTSLHTTLSNGGGGGGGILESDKQTFSTVSTTTINNTYEQSTISSPSDEVIWGRVYRRSDGNLIFPGIDRYTFKSSNSVLKRIYRIATTQDNLSLSLPSAAIQNEIEESHRPENSLTNSLPSLTSRKGFHVCLCCRLTFSNSAMYENHLNRSVARILYRCHLCHESSSSLSNHISTSYELIDITDVDSDQPDNNNHNLNSVESITYPLDNSHNLGNNKNEEVYYRFYSILPGGIVKATNYCAIFTHLTSAHPNKMKDWILKPSLLTISTLNEPIWMTTAIIRKANTSTDGTIDEASTMCTRTHLSNLLPYEPDGKIQSDLFSNDLGLSGILNDLQQCLNNISTLGNFDLLQPSCLTSNCLQSKLVITSDYTYNDMIMEIYSSLKRIFTPLSSNDTSSLKTTITNEDDIYQAYPCLPSLPSSNSSLFKVILNLSRLEIWHSHLFLPQSCDNSTSSIVTSQNTLYHLDKDDAGNILIHIDDDDDDDDDNINDYNAGGRSDDDDNDDDIGDNKLEMKQLSRKKLCTTCLPPSAPSNTYLNNALELIMSSNRTRYPSITSLITSIDQISNSSLTNETIHTQNKPVINLNDGVLHCLICKFRTNDCKALIEHLTGAQPMTHSKCGLCGQLLYVNHPSLCSVKAHLLLHLGCFLMCPRCGFTPPPYLAPDCAELCLRVHLRFVCYHFNLKEVYQCNYCPEGRGKGYTSCENLFQHQIDHHVKRVYVCLWCVQQATGEMTNNNNGNHHQDDQLTAMNSIMNPNKNNTNNTTQSGVILKKNYPVSVHHMGVQVNKDNIQSQYSTSSPHTQSRPSSNKSNSSYDSGDISVHSKEEKGFRSSCLKKLLYHFRNIHSHNVCIPVNERNDTSSLQETAELVDSNTISTTTTTTITTATSPLPSIPSIITNYEQTSKIEPTTSTTTVINSDVKISLSSFNSERNSFIHEDILYTDRQQDHNYHDKNIMKSKPTVNLILNVDYTIGFHCIECSKYMDTKENYVEHFQTVHGSKCIRECYYRCFGSCKRLLADIDVFREHLNGCHHAQVIYQSTFGNDINKDISIPMNTTNNTSISSSSSCCNIDKITTNELLVSSNDNNSRLYSEKSQKSKTCTTSTPWLHNRKLCFCAYCGIGSRRKNILLLLHLHHHCLLFKILRLLPTVCLQSCMYQMKLILFQI